MYTTFKEKGNTNQENNPNLEVFASLLTGCYSKRKELAPGFGSKFLPWRVAHTDGYFKYSFCNSRFPSEKYQNILKMTIFVAETKLGNQKNKA